MKKHSVLYIEDDSDLSHSISSCLNDFCETQCVPTLDQAQKMLQENNYDLILCDKSLPDGDGIEFGEELCRSYPDTPIIYTTGSADITSKIAGLTSAGGKDYIVKPFDVRELRIRIKNCLTPFNT